MEVTVPDKIPRCKWAIYLIYSPSLHRTYVGASTDVERRVRQHRGELKQGAKATSKATDWMLVCAITNFPSRSEAYRWEKIIKGRTTGLKGRTIGFIQVGAGMCPAPPSGKKVTKAYRVPDGLKFHAGKDRFETKE